MPAHLTAVELHEAEHLRRPDLLIQWFALLNRAIFWLHPLSWWLERRISELAEEATDDVVIRRGTDPHGLVHFSPDFSTGQWQIVRI